MKIILVSFVAVVVLSIAAGLILNGMDYSSGAQNSGAAVRLDETN